MTSRIVGCLASTMSDHDDGYGPSTYGDRIRFANTPELDLMARLAGLRLRERWADWDRTPFSGGCAKHISVWERDPDAGADP